jgi:glycosyltransferase involved in cell wall biosynthesis
MAGGPPDGPEDDHPGVRVVGIDAGVGAASPLATYLTGRPVLAGKQLAEALDGRYDVLHFHNPSLLGGPEALSLGSARVKLYTAHEQWLLCPTHVLWKYQSRVCEKPDCVRCTLTYRRPPQPWRSSSLLERSVAHLDALICPSRTSQRLHERFAGLVRLERLGHFIPDPTVSEASDNADRPYFLYAGRLESIKGVESLLRVFRSRRSEDLLIAGEGTLEGALREQAAGLEHVRFLGWQTPEQLDALYRGAIAAVVPTAGHESFGLVALEAMARGVPVVARDFGALGELLAESRGGLGFTTDDDLEAALGRLAGDPELRAELGVKGRAAFEARYTEERHVDAYLGLVAELAAA